MPKISVTYDHPRLGPIQIQDVSEVSVTAADAMGVNVIAYRGPKGEHVTFTTNVQFLVREEQEGQNEPPEAG